MDRIPHRQRTTIALLVFMIALNVGFLLWALYDSAVVHRQNDRSIRERKANAEAIRAVDARVRALEARSCP